MLRCTKHERRTWGSGMNQIATAQRTGRASAANADPKLAIRQVGPTFGAEVSGMPIHGDVSPELLTEFISLLHRYRVLIVPAASADPAVPDVGLDPADLVAFIRRLGPLEIHSRFENTFTAHREAFSVR